MMKAKLTGGLLAALCLFSFSGASIASAQSADLQLTKVKNDILPIAPGDTGVEYTLTVTNLGPDTAVNVFLQEDYNFDLVYEASAPFCTGGFDPACSLGDIPAGQSRTMVVTFTLPASYAPAVPIKNSALVYSATSDPDSDNNYAEAWAEVAGVNCGDLEVSTGGFHTCARVAGNGRLVNNLPDDVVECWGDNTYDQSAPVPAGAFAQVSAGVEHTCGVTTAGSLECWSVDNYGQATPPSGTDFTKVSSGWFYSCAIRTDQSITCWGSATEYPEVLSPPSGQFTQVSVGYTHACALRTNGTLACWGDNTTLLTNQIVTNTPSGTDWVQVSADSQYACALKDDGTVTCWGRDSGGGETLAPGGAFTQISTGEGQACGLRAGGVAECWGGSNSNGELDEPLEAFTAIDTGGYHICGLLSDGSVLCWGYDFSFQATPPARSNNCPDCGDGLVEAPAESCEASAPGSGIFDICCSSVTCRPYRLTEKHVCRAAAGGCDAPETCNGLSSSTCPAPGGRRPFGYTCRAAVGGCDPVETCSGLSDDCPIDDPIADAGFVCRASVGSCDVQEVCTGSSSTCPTNVVVNAGSTCRALAGPCDVVETCNGSSGLCPNDAFLSSSTECRSAPLICDVAENCSGSSATCPADAVRDSSVECRASAGVCDQAETCDGSAKTCPVDTKKGTSDVCRSAAGACDAQEVCTGSGNSCPGDSKLPGGTVCRGAISNCDVAETCSGFSDTCPTNAIASSAVVCRAAADGCDVAENCTGSSTVCPGNGFANAGVSCNDVLFCNGADSCNGSGSCSQHAGDPCPGVDGDGNCAESCNEATNLCNALDPSGSACNDGDACTDPDTCTAGVCDGSTRDCADESLCTVDTCNSAIGCEHTDEELPPSSCYVATRSTLQIRRNPDDASKNALKWTWRKGEAVDPLDLGAPNVDTDYELCVFDHSAGVSRLAGSIALPAGSAALWKIKEGQVQYGDKEALTAGVKQVKAKADPRPEKSGMSMATVGSALTLPPLFSASEFFDIDSSVTVQMRNSIGVCWTSDLSEASFDRNDSEGVKADTQ